jgi:integrase
VAAKIGSEVYFSLRTSDPSSVKRRQAADIDQLEAHFQTLRTGLQPLSHKDRVAFSGLVYLEFVKRFEHHPGSPWVWEVFKDGFDEDVLSGPEGVSEWFGEFIDSLALREGFVPDPESRRAIAKEVARAFIEAASRLERNANGDYSPDPAAARFPPWEKNKPNASAVSIHDVFQRWQKERKPSASTISTWRGCVAGFVAHLGHDDMARVTRADVLAWKNALIDRDLSPETINGGHLATLITLYGFAVANDLVPGNPADGVKVLQKRRAGASQLPCEEPEVARILSLSQREKLPYRRWFPWLLALIGARVGEVAQLWGRRIVVEDGIPSMRIAPAEDGGSLKNEGSERTVPIHRAIIGQGFLDFLASKGDGPLFYHRRAAGQKHPSKGVGNHLAEWIREQGFTDKRKAPNHAFRHWFKTACMSEGILDSLADAIQGHAGNQGEARRYRHGHTRTMVEAIARLKVPS